MALLIAAAYSQEGGLETRAMGVIELLRMTLV